MRKLTAEECLETIAKGEFAPEVTKAAEAVAVVLTQSWCPQWGWMKSYIAGLAPEAGEVFWVEYDLEGYFEAFMRFKERAFGNDQVPYVRYYRGGELAAESNYIDKGGFLRLLTGKAREGSASVERE
jgi:hypothetical protein